jgi:sugar lactone lactonase YvrE
MYLSLQEAPPMRRLFRSALVVLAVAAAAVTVATVPAAATATPTSTRLFPTTISLPNGFRPEGLAIRGLFAFSGSLVDGRIARLNLVNGEVTVLGHAPGAPSTGMKADDHGRLFVAGGPSGQARVVNAATGAVLATFQVATPNASFINDVVLTPDAAYFTDSINPTLYKLPLGRNGALPAADQVVDIPLGGDFVTGPGFNANGISRTPDGRALVIVQTNTGLLFRVDPATGVARTVDLGGQTVVNGDGIFLSGRTLFVVQNQNNLVASVRLDADGRHGTVVSRVTDARFDVPTAVAPFGNRLYLVNARFDQTPTPDTTFTVVAIHRPE